MKCPSLARYVRYAAVIAVLGTAAQVRAADPAPWAPNKAYVLNALVAFNAIVYQCRQAHTSQIGQEPPKVPALWMRPTPVGVTEWAVQTNYVLGSQVVHKGLPYKCTQAHVSQIDWAPDVAFTLWSKQTVVASCGGQKDGTFCDDKSKCTKVDQCQAGICVGSTAVTCAASLTCQTNACDPTTGQCKITNQPAGTSCGKLQFCDGAGACKAPKIVTAPVNPAAIEPGPETPVCAPGVDPGAITTDSSGEKVFTRLTYVDNQPPPPGSTCREPVRFCDENDVEVPRPSEEVLNAPAAVTDQCPAVPPPDPSLCGVDATTLGGSCTKDADCAAGSLCAILCTDPLCLRPVERRCGKLRADCGGVPAADTCDQRVFRICPPAGAVGTVTEQEAAAQLPNQTEPQPTAELPPEQQLKVEPYAKLADRVCALELASVVKEQAQQQPPKPAAGQSSTGMMTLGNNTWGLFMAPRFLEGVKVDFKKDVFSEDFEVKTNTSFDLGGFVNGNKITALGINFDAVARTCGANAGFSIKIFGDTVASVDFVQGVEAGFGPLALSERGFGNAAADVLACDQKLTEAFRQSGVFRRKLFADRNIQDFYRKNGVSKDLCTRSKKFLDLKDLNCDDPATYRDNRDIPNAWHDEFTKSTMEYLGVKADLTLAKDKISASARLRFLDINESFTLGGIHKVFTIGPVPVTIALDMQGSYQFKGSLELGTSYKADQPRSDVPGLGPFLTEQSTLRILAGPVFEPAQTWNVLVFAGIGVPAASAGVEGTIKLISVKLPLNVRAAAIRQVLPDPRDVQQSDFKGEPIPELTNVVARWRFGWSWGAKLNLSALDGKVDIVLRVKLLFAKKSWRFKLFDWKGFSKEFLLIGKASDGDPLTGFNGFGDHAKDIAFTKIQPLTAADVPAAFNDTAFYNDVLGDEKCVIIE